MLQVKDKYGTKEKNGKIPIQKKKLKFYWKKFMIEIDVKKLVKN